MLRRPLSASNESSASVRLRSTNSDAQSGAKMINVTTTDLVTIVIAEVIALCIKTVIYLAW